MVEVPVSTLPRTYAWYEVWWNILLRPTQKTFLSILTDPGASNERAYVWVAVTSFLGALMQVLAIMGLGGRELSGGFATIMWIIVPIIAPILTVIGLLIQAGITHMVSRWFGGQGMSDNLIYLFGAIYAPVALLSSFLGALTTPLRLEEETAFDTAALCVLPFSFALGIYVVFLYVQAVRAGEQLGLGKAILTVILPPVAIYIVIFGCVFLFTWV